MPRRLVHAAPADQEGVFPSGRRHGVLVCTPSSPGFPPHLWGDCRGRPRDLVQPNNAVLNRNPLCFTYSIVSILWPGPACPSCLAYVEGARRCCHYRPYGRKPAERSSVGCVNTVGRSPKWEETLHLSCLESHFDFAIKMCKSSPHRPVVETDYTSLQTYLDCSLS